MNTEESVLSVLNVDRPGSLRSPLPKSSAQFSRNRLADLLFMIADSSNLEAVLEIFQSIRTSIPFPVILFHSFSPQQVAMASKLLSWAATIRPAHAEDSAPLLSGQLHFVHWQQPITIDRAIFRCASSHQSQSLEKSLSKASKEFGSGLVAVTFSNCFLRSRNGFKHVFRRKGKVFCIKAKEDTLPKSDSLFDGSVEVLESPAEIVQTLFPLQQKIDGNVGPAIVPQSVESSIVQHSFLDSYRIQLDLGQYSPSRNARELQQVQQRYLEHFEFAPVGYLTIDSRGTIQEINHTGSVVLGLDRSHLIGQPFALFLNGKEARKFQLHLTQCRRTSHKTSVRLSLDLPNGEQPVVNLISLQIGRQNGHDAKIRSILTGIPSKNISRKRSYHKSLSQGLYQSTLAEVSQWALAGIEPVDLLQRVGKVLAQTLSADLVTIFELTSDGTAFHLAEGIGWKADAEVPSKVSLMMMDGYALLSDWPIVMTNASRERRFTVPSYIKFHSITSSLVSTIQGHPRPFGLLGIHSCQRRTFNREDVNFLRSIANVLAAAFERKRIEQALVESERKLRLIAENMSDTVLTYDLSGKLIYANPAFERLTGYSLDELRAQNFIPYFHSDDAEKMMSLRSQLFKGNSYSDVEYRLLRKDGEIKWCSGTWGPLLDEDGRRIGVQGHEVDITERKQAKELMERSLRSNINILLQEIHHRVKNNLQVVCSLLNLQSGYVSDPKTLDMFRECQNRVRSMALIHEKLYQSNELTHVEFSEYARTLMAHLRSSYRMSADFITLTVDADDAPLDINVAVPCGLIVTELISNALKYAFPPAWQEEHPDEGKVQLSFHVIGHDFRLVVSDNGIGLPADLNVGQTNSLGLRLVRTLVAQLEGKLEVDSEKGTRWVISFRAPSLTFHQ